MPLDDAALATLFTEARTHNAWTDQPVSDDDLRAVFDLMKMAPTSANCAPARFVFIRTPEGKEKLKPALSSGNLEKTMAAPVTVIVGCDGDRWSVKRALFDAKYRPEPGTIAGESGSYRNVPSPVHARQYAQPFAVTRTSGDVLHGRPGDWLLQYGKGDHGIADAGRFARVYRSIDA